MTVKVYSKLKSNLKLGKYLIKAGSFIELAKDEAKELLELYPDKVELRTKTKTKTKRNDNNHDS